MAENQMSPEVPINQESQDTARTAGAGISENTIPDNANKDEYIKGWMAGSASSLAGDFNNNDISFEEKQKAMAKIGERIKDQETLSPSQLTEKEHEEAKANEAQKIATNDKKEPVAQPTTTTVEQEAESKERKLEPWEEEMVKKGQLETGSGDLLAKMKRERQLIDHSKDANGETKTAGSEVKNETTEKKTGPTNAEQKTTLKEVEEKASPTPVTTVEKDVSPPTPQVEEKSQELEEKEAELLLDKAGDLLIKAADSLEGKPIKSSEGSQYNLNDEDFVYKAFDKVGDLIEKGAIGAEKTIRKMAELIKKIGKFNKNDKNVAATEASSVIVAGESAKAAPETPAQPNPAVQPTEKAPAGETGQSVKEITADKKMYPDEEFKLKRERYEYEERPGATALDPRKLVDKKGNFVPDPRTGKDFEYAYNSEANDFFDYLDKEAEKKQAETVQAPVPTGTTEPEVPAEAQKQPVEKAVSKEASGNNTVQESYTEAVGARKMLEAVQRAKRLREGTATEEDKNYVPVIRENRSQEEIEKDEAIAMFETVQREKRLVGSKA